MQVSNRRILMQTASHVKPLIVSYQLISNNKKSEHFCSLFAEREGFEPPEALTSTVFKTAAIDHSAISPDDFIIVVV